MSFIGPGFDTASHTYGSSFLQYRVVPQPFFVFTYLTFWSVQTSFLCGVSFNLSLSDVSVYLMLFVGGGLQKFCELLSVS